MKITCKQQDLSKGLSIVGHAISSRSTLPILANILVATDRGRVKLSATNLEMGVTCWIDADVHEEGATTVPAKTFTDLLNSLRQGPIEFVVSDDSHVASIVSTGSNSTIRGMDPTEFPSIPGVEESSDVLTLPSDLLKEMIAQVAIASADDDSRPVLTGIEVRLQDEILSFAAADAFRLALRKATIPPGIVDALGPVLIPAKTLKELARILPAGEEDVQLIVSPNKSQVLFHTERIDLATRLIEGTFPNVLAAIPKECTTRAVVETKEFAAAVKTVTPFARDSSNITRVTVTNSQEHGRGTLTVASTAEDLGSNVTTIPAVIDGPDQEIIFNVKYLGDVLGVLDTVEVALEVVSAARPGVIKPVGENIFTYVIMPMSTNR